MTTFSEQGRALHNVDLLGRYMNARGRQEAVGAKNKQRINNQAKNKPLLQLLLLVFLASKDEPPTSASLLRAEDHTILKTFVMMFPH